MTAPGKTLQISIVNDKVMNVGASQSQSAYPYQPSNNQRGKRRSNQSMTRRNNKPYQNTTSKFRPQNQQSFQSQPSQPFIQNRPHSPRDNTSVGLLLKKMN